MTLTPQEYEAIRRFAEGETPPAIAEALGLRWMEVRDLLNIHVTGHQGKAKRLIETTPRPEGMVPLAPPVRPKPTKAVPARLAEEPVPAATLPKPNVDDLQSLQDVVRAAQGTPHQDAADKAVETLTAVRDAIIADRAKAAVATRIAELEAELAGLRELVAA